MLRRDGYVRPEENRVELSSSLRPQILSKTRDLNTDTSAEVTQIAIRYCELPQKELLRYVYSNYPWYASKSRLAVDFDTEQIPAIPPEPAVFTMGYEGYSIDGFFDRILRIGVHTILDVRSNPQSRSYGFSQSTLKDIGAKLGVQYLHFPELGVSSETRKQLAGKSARRTLLENYERVTLASATQQVQEVGNLMKQFPSILLCVESDPHTCHRSRLAPAVARCSGLKVVHI